MGLTKARLRFSFEESQAKCARIKSRRNFSNYLHQFCYFADTVITTVRLFVHKYAGCLWWRKRTHDYAGYAGAENIVYPATHFLISFSVFSWIRISEGSQLLTQWTQITKIPFSSAFNANAHNALLPSLVYNPMIRKVSFLHSPRCLLWYQDDQERFQWQKADFGRCPGK